ncbi:inositol monophosphatase family protein [Deferribacterales bacterium RsTz2092]|nr:inositol monophosphatase [Deferribacterales bacterium]
MNAILEGLLPIVKSAGSKMKQFFDSADKDVQFKGEIDLVTQYDVALERELTAAFNKVFPDFRVIGEESSPFDIGMQSGKVIYLDPIDGTTSFVHRFPFTCISAGVYIDEQPHCGVVYNPILNELFCAAKGEGAYMNGERIHVSNTDKAVRSLFATGFPYDKELRRKTVHKFAHMLDITQGMRRAGSAALDLCYVARGTFDVYYESTLRPWDMAAGIVIVEEAGGKVTDLAGKPFRLGLDYLLATNGKVHEEFLRELNSVK